LSGFHILYTPLADLYMILWGEKCWCYPQFTDETTKMDFVPLD
jgi:hypothetical protein